MDVNYAYIDSNGQFYCAECADTYSNEFGDLDEILEIDFDYFSPCEQCQQDAFGRDMETDFISVVAYDKLKETLRKILEELSG